MSGENASADGTSGSPTSPPTQLPRHGLDTKQSLQEPARWHRALAALAARTRSSPSRSAAVRAPTTVRRASSSTGRVHSICGEVHSTAGSVSAQASDVGHDRGVLRVPESRNVPTPMTPPPQPRSQSAWCDETMPGAAAYRRGCATFSSQFECRPIASAALWAAVVTDARTISSKWSA